MSPEAQVRSRKSVSASDNVYTVMLFAAFLAILATALLVSYKCYFQYGTIFKIP
jgi:hypothetical protein